jgi:hypothetical protein
MSRGRFFISVITALYVGALIGLTFMPVPDEARASWLLHWAAFVPVGFLLVALMGARRWWAAIAFGVLGAAWVEAAQWIWMPEGYAALADVGWCSFGAIAGVTLGALTVAAAGRSMRSHEAHRVVPQAVHREIPWDQRSGATIPPES